MPVTCLFHSGCIYVQGFSDFVWWSFSFKASFFWQSTRPEYILCVLSRLPNLTCKWSLRRCTLSPGAPCCSTAYPKSQRCSLCVFVCPALTFLVDFESSQSEVSDWLMVHFQSQDVLWAVGLVAQDMCTCIHVAWLRVI